MQGMDAMGAIGRDLPADAGTIGKLTCSLSKSDRARLARLAGQSKECDKQWLIGMRSGAQRRRPRRWWYYCPQCASLT